MKTIYIIAGVSGAGKSWVLDNVNVGCQQLKDDDFGGARGTPDILSIIDQSRSDIFLLEKTIHVSTFIKRNKHKYNIYLIVVGGDFLKVKQQLIDRGGAVTSHLYKRWNRMAQLTEQYSAVYGDSSFIVDYLNNNIKHCLVYKATSPSGKIYIGKTSHGLKERIRAHADEAPKNRQHGCPAFHNAINKYRIDTFNWEVLHSDLTFIEVTIKELEEIKRHDSSNPDVGYNLIEASNRIGVATHSKATRLKISTSVKKTAHKAWDSVERRRRASATMTAQWQDPKITSKRSKAIKEVRSSDEQRKVTSLDSIQRYSDPAKRDAMAIACGAKEFEVRKKDGTFVGRWVNAAKCAKDLGLASKGHISSCLHGRKKTYCNYTFSYVSETNN